MRRFSQRAQFDLVAVLLVGVATYLSVSALFSSWAPALLDATLPPAVALVLVNLLAVRLPRGDVIVIDGAIVVGVLLLFGGDVALLSLVLGGIIGSVWLRAGVGERVRHLVDLSRRVLVVWATAHGAQVLVSAGSDIGDLRSLVAAMSTGLVYMMLDLGTHAVVQTLRERVDLMESIRSVVRPVFFLYVGQVGLGVALAIVYRGMGVLSVVVLGVLASILLNAFNMYLRTKMMYQQTIRALARASMLQQETPHMDSRLVADLCVAVGRRLGLHGRSLERLNYAALLRDVGHLGRTNEIADMDDHAYSGAALVESVPFLQDTACMIRHHHDPSSMLGSLEPGDALGAAVIHLCEDFVERAFLSQQLGSREGRLNALTELRCGSNDEYGESVIAALTQLLSDPQSSAKYEWVLNEPC